MAESVFEIDPEILDRFTRQLLDDAGVETIGERRFEIERARKRRRIGRVLLERAQGDRAELAGQGRVEQMRAAVDRMDRLPARRVAGKLLGRSNIRLVERVEKGGQRVVRDRRLGHHAAV